MGATVSAIALGSGWDLGPAFGLRPVLAARDVAAIVLVRGQIRGLKGRPTGASTIYAVQAACIGVVAIAASWTSPRGSRLWRLRLSVLSGSRLVQSAAGEARVIGWTQMGVGLMVVLVTAAGVHLGW